MHRIAVGLSCVAVSACFIPVDAGSDHRCIIGSDQTCSESPSSAALAGTCRADGTCLCNAGFSLLATSGRCVAMAGAGGTAGGSAGGGAAAGGASGGGTAGGVAGGGLAGGGSAAAGGTAQGGGAPGSPNVMLLLDVSGSMNAPLDSAEPSCQQCSGLSCAPTCPTRISTLRRSLDSFLQANVVAARFGVTSFPAANASFSPTGCAPADQQAISLPSGFDAPSALTAQTQIVRAWVQGLGSATPITGGTPTAASLRFLATLPSLTSAGRPGGVILVTDGLPNCNVNNPLRCDSSPPAPADLCTLGANCLGQYCRAGYLDQSETVLAVAALRSAGVRTAVVGLSKEVVVNVSVVSVMNSMADQGGATACTPGPGCDVRYFAAEDDVQLTAALNAAFARVTQ